MANMRITGMTSGFDTDTMIKDLMKAESARVDKVKKSRQYAVWQQEGFREIIGKLRTFQSNFLDTLNASQNLRSKTSFAKFSYSVMSEGVTSSKVSITANADVKNKDIIINRIDQLATKDTWEGRLSGIRGITSGDITISDLKDSLTAAGKDLEINLSIGNSIKKITLQNNDINLTDTVDDLATKIQAKVTEAFGSNYSSVVVSDGSKLKFDMTGSEVKVMQYGDNTTSMNALFGSVNAQSSYAYQSKSLKDLFGLTDAVLSNISINGKNITLSETDTVSKMIEKVNASEANVNLSYNTLSDKFTLTSKVEGSANNVSITDASSAETLFSKLFGVGDVVDATGNAMEGASGIRRDDGLNALLSINDVSIVQGNNTFSLDGMTFTLKETSTSEISIKTTTDTNAIVDNIKNFVKEYNDIVDFITAKLSEKRNYSFEPLTDDEREALSDEEIEKWETKAKAGNMRGSSELSSMLTELRNAIIEPIEGVGLSMSQIGISSGSYLDKGKLTIDESKLKSAIENNYEEVVNLFTKESTTTYANSADRTIRNKENGIASRFDDILKDNIRTTRDANGNKGRLIMKAGIENDSSQFSNDFQKKIGGYDERIADLLEYLSDKEDYYYTMFSKMESALSQMQSQSASLMSQLGTS